MACPRKAPLPEVVQLITISLQPRRICTLGTADCGRGGEERSGGLLVRVERSLAIVAVGMFLVMRLGGPQVSSKEFIYMMPEGVIGKLDWARQ